jgi:hypothetical protein
MGTAYFQDGLKFRFASFLPHWQAAYGGEEEGIE